MCVCIYIYIYIYMYIYIYIYIGGLVSSTSRCRLLRSTPCGSSNRHTAKLLASLLGRLTHLG